MAYTNRSVSDTDPYVRIKIEALILKWACQKFNDYTIIMKCNTDHKPLVPVLSTTNLDELSPSIQRMKLMRYRYNTISHGPRKGLIIADIIAHSSSEGWHKQNRQGNGGVSICYVTWDSCHLCARDYSL